LAEVKVTDPSHPLYGRRFALLSTRPRPHRVGYIFVVYRDTMVLRIPQAATSLVMPPPEPQPLTKHDLEGYEPNFGCPKTFLM
jgi:hypothetical protein